MKRFCTILLIIGFLALPSCEKDEPFEYTDNYLYTEIDSVLYRISPASASVTPVCPDPLCAHSSDVCAFYGVSRIVFSGQYMYYLKGGSTDGYYDKLCRYDMKEGVSEELYRPSEGAIADLYAYEDYVFLSQTLINSKTEIEHWLYRYSIKDKGAIRLTDEPAKDIYTCIRVENERAYWHGSTYYSTDLDYKDLRENDRAYSQNLTMGDYSYIYEFADYTVGADGFKHPAVKLDRINNKTGEVTTVLKDVGFVPMMYGDKIIYARNDSPKLIGMLYNDYNECFEQFYDKYGGKYYICDADGSNERLLCDLNGTGCVIVNARRMMGGKYGVGEWIAIKAQHYTEPDENGIVAPDGERFLIININTGELKVAEIEKRT